MRLRSLGLLVGTTLAVLAAPATGGEERVFVEARVLCPVLVRSEPGGAKGPLVVGIHGRGDTAEGFARVWEAFGRPRPAFAVPEAPYPLLLTGGKIGWSWDFPSQDRNLWARADPEVARYILAVVREVRASREVGGVYLLAHSQGVAYVFMAMAEEPGAVRGVIAFAGVLPGELLPDTALARAAAVTRVFIAHGRQDEAVGIASSRKARERLSRLGFDVTLREFEGGHTVPAEVLREAQDWIAASEKAAAAP
ncbi:MAG: alpha/beta hydrolase [Thermoanaerobaculaceae bacterium]